MKRRQSIVTSVSAVALAIAGSLWISRPVDRDGEVVLVPPPESPPKGELRASADREAVFKRAFWRRPVADDRIVNARLTEWLEEGSGISRWQWFIEVEPSVELKRWLRQRNPFALAVTEANQLEGGATAAPDWFPESARGFEIHQSADGRMSLLFSREGNVLFGTASGLGFAAGAPEAEKPIVKIESTGRLPLTSPPNPSQP